MNFKFNRFQNKRAKVKNSTGGSANTTPFPSPSTSRSSSPLMMLAQQQQGQQSVQKGQPRLIPASFTPEHLAALAAATHQPLPMSPQAFFEMLSGRSGVNPLLALAALSPHQQQALADLPGLLSSNAHILPTPIAPAPVPHSHAQLPTPIAPAPSPSELHKAATSNTLITAAAM